ncbi:MAG: glycosyltransferase family 4 protein [Candidatus Omnitrophica bacterium]|nr:glycosyltransferase family 4 protein [Candidatus Omnitrophota bacterium]
MRILQVVHGFPPHNMAGAEIYTYNLSKELSKRNEVFVFYRISDLKKREYELDSNNSNGLEIFTLNNTFRFCDSFEKFYKNDDITKQFADILDRMKPDIVHIQHLIFLSTTIINEVKRRKIPIVFTLHDYWLICPQWHFLREDFTICDNNNVSQCIDCLDYQLNIKKTPKRIYLTFRNILPDFLIRFSKNIYFSWARDTLDCKNAHERIEARLKHIKEICQMIDIFIAPSQFLKTRFIEFGIPEDKIKFIPHGIDTSPFTNFRRKESNRIRFGFIGTILPAKGLDILINAFNRVKDNRAELKVYGNLFPYNGFEYYPRYIKRLAKNRNIRFMGGFNHQDIAGVFSEFDVLVLPSIWNENCPLTILEAFSTKTPVIASKIGGIPALIKDKENGLLFEAGDPDGLYDKMRIFINNPDLIKELRANLVSPKSIEENSREIEEIYYKFLS